MVRFGYSSDSSSSQHSHDDGSGHEYGSDSDSEEEQWPVGPPGSIGLNGFAVASAKGKGRATTQGEGLGRSAGRNDRWEEWEDRERAQTWATANKSFHLALSRSYSLTPHPQPRTTDPELNSIQSLLSTLALSTAADTLALQTEFTKRNERLWTSIEASIALAEKEQEDKERAKELQEARIKSLQREAEAKGMREEAQRLEHAEQEARRKKEAEDKLLQAQARKEEETKARKAVKSAAVVAQSTVEGSPKAEYERWTQKIIHIKTVILPIVSQNPSYRKACFQAKRFITPKIGQLTNFRPAISRILSQISDHLNTLRTADGTNQEPYIWTLNHLAKALVKQAEAEVTVSLGTAFPLGRVVVGLLARGHADLGEVLMARLVKKCFWITGWWPTKRPDQSTADHLKTLGHAPPSSSETLLQYSSRMSGLLALYFAILQTSPNEAPQSIPSSPAPSSFIPVHFQPAAAWRWLVLILQPPLVSLEPTPLLLITFLEIAGETMLSIYGKQFAKLLEVLGREGLGEGKAGFSEKGRSSVVRVMLWLEDWEKGRVETARGRACDS